MSVRIRSIVPVLALAAAAPAWAGGKDFVIYAPGVGGTAQQAKPYLDKFFHYVEGALGWPAGSASGDYFDEPKLALDYIKTKQPGYGLLSPSLYLELACPKGGPEPLAAIVGISGNTSSGRYHVVVKDAAIVKLDDLKGKRLISNHLQNERFITRVVFDGKIDAGKFFQLQPTNSPVKPFKAVDRGEADAALVDDAQLAHMKSLPIGGALKVVYSSQPLPPFPVVAWAGVAKAAEIATMKKTLLGMCGSPTGGEVCKALQINKFDGLDAGAYRVAVQKYCAP
jgi:hypothetical protein